MSKYNEKTQAGDSSEIDIRELVASKEAIPEIKYKYDIFAQLNEVKEAEKVLNYNRWINGGVINQNDLFKFQSELIALWTQVKNMLAEIRYWDTDILVKKITKDCDWVRMEMLEYGKVNRYPLTVLLRLKNYVMRGMHRCRLTDLLLEGEVDPFTEFHQQYE